MNGYEVFAIGIIAAAIVCWRIFDVARVKLLHDAQMQIAQMEVCNDCPLNLTPLARAQKDMVAKEAKS